MAATFDVKGPSEGRSAISAFAAAVLLLSGLTDLIGGWKLGSVVTLGIVIWCWLPLRTRLQELRYLWATLYPFVLLLLWAVLSFAWQHPFISGLENLAVLSLFLGLILYNSRTDGVGYRFSTIVSSAVWAASILYAFSLILNGPGSSSILGARIFGLFALLGISWHVAQACGSVRRNVEYAVVLLLLVALSLSRMAFAIGIALFPLAALIAGVKGRRSRLVAVAAVVVIVGAIAMLRFKPLTERFEAEQGAMSSVELGNVDLDTSGRMVMWAIVWQSFLDSPWLGNGAGAAADLVDNTIPGVSHPHCDYLMMLHDYGIIGLLLFILGLGNLTYRLWRRWRAARQLDNGEAILRLSTLLFLVAMMLAMITDNCMSYTYLMAPLAIMIGVSFRPQELRCDQI